MKHRWRKVLTWKPQWNTLISTLLVGVCIFDCCFVKLFHRNRGRLDKDLIWQGQLNINWNQRRLVNGGRGGNTSSFLREKGRSNYEKKSFNIFPHFKIFIIWKNIFLSSLEKKPTVFFFCSLKTCEYISEVWHVWVLALIHSEAGYIQMPVLFCM